MTERRQVVTPLLDPWSEKGHIQVCEVQTPESTMSYPQKWFVT